MSTYLAVGGSGGRFGSLVLYRESTLTSRVRVDEARGALVGDEILSDTSWSEPGDNTCI